MVLAASSLSSRAGRAPCGAGACPWPAWSRLPKIRSWTSLGFTPACSIAALMATAPSCDAVTELNLPCMDPMGVRLAPTMTMLSAIEALLDSWGWSISELEALHLLEIRGVRKKWRLDLDAIRVDHA